LAREGRKALIPFITAGDPDPGLTVTLMHALVQAGADVIELGVPFSDPMADGPTIQRASERALAHRVGLRDVLAMAGEFRERDKTTPVVLMGYANPVEAMGYAQFCERAKAAGVDGVLIVDYPPEECAELADRLSRNGVDPIFLLAPTTQPERVKRIAALARGYVYYVALTGVTGAAHLDVEDVRRRLQSLRGHLGVPIGVGFGIRDAATARAVAQMADAVVVGSRIVQEIESSPREHAVANVTRLVRELRAAVDGG
ncbi:MAG TPA: tryptophan synthase subunit alpha, partial [Burkholderiales bacterium]